MLKPAVLRVAGCTKCSFEVWPSSLNTNRTTSAKPTYFEEASCPGKWRTVFLGHHLCRDAVGTARHITPAEDAVFLQSLVQAAVLLHLSALGITRPYGHFRTKGCWKLLHTFPPTVCNIFLVDVHLGKHTKQETSIIYGQTGKIIFSTAV